MCCSPFCCRRLLSPVEVFALLTASLCHDLEHPGTNNAYQVNAQTDFAIRYNDVSVLENHHAAVCFHLLRSTNLLSRVTREQFKEVLHDLLLAVLSSCLCSCTRCNDVAWYCSFDVSRLLPFSQRT
jgi:hypothetical protein